MTSRRQTKPIPPEAKIPPVIALDSVQHTEIRTRVRNGKSFEEITRSVGLAGFQRIADQAFDRLYNSRIKKAFRHAYDEFKAKWSEERRRKRKAGIKEDRDALAAFAQDVLDLDRGTAGKYIAGKIKKTDTITLDKYLMRIGTSLNRTLPSPEETKRAVFSETATAMLRARKINGIRVELTEDELTAIEWIYHAHPPDELALRSRKAWGHYIQYLNLITQKTSWKLGPDWLSGILTGDWAAALDNKWLPWQFLVALIVLHRLSASRAQASEPDENSDDWDWHRDADGQSWYLGMTIEEWTCLHGCYFAPLSDATISRVIQSLRSHRFTWPPSWHHIQLSNKDLLDYLVMERKDRMKKSP